MLPFRVGPSTIHGNAGGGTGTGGEFADGDAVSGNWNGAYWHNVASWWYWYCRQHEFVFSTTTAGGTYNLGSGKIQATLFGDRSLPF